MTDFTGIFMFLWNWSAEPTWANASLSVRTSAFSYCSQSERTEYNLLVYALPSYVHMHTD